MIEKKLIQLKITLEDFNKVKKALKITAMNRSNFIRRAMMLEAHKILKENSTEVSQFNKFIE